MKIARPLLLAAGIVALLAGCESRPDLPASTAACQRHVLSPDQRADAADLVFEGKVVAASCTCMPLASGPDTYGAKAECTDLLEVIKTSKGALPPQFTYQNFVVLGDDPNAVMSHDTCTDLAAQRDKTAIGENDMYYIKKTGGTYESIPLSYCD